MKTLFLWLDAHSAVYWLVALAATGACAWCQTSARSSSVRALALLLLLAAWRWPVLLEVHPSGRAEATLIADAITLTARLPVATVDVLRDGTVAALTLVPLHWLGLPLDYFSARLMGLLMDWGTLCFVGVILLRLWPASVVQFALMPIAVGLARAGAIAGYSPTQPGCLLVAFAAWLHWRSDADTRPRVRGVVLGATLAVLPWISFAAGAAGLGVWLAGAAFNIIMARRPDPATRTRCAWAGFGLLYGLALVFAALHGTNRLGTVLLGYLLDGILGARTWLLAFGVGPLALFVGAWVAKLCTAKPELTARVACYLALAAVAALVAGQGTPAIIGGLAEAWRHPLGALAGRIRGMQHPGDSLAVLGGGAYLHVETALPRACDRRHLLQTLEGNRPEFIVVAASVGEEWAEVADFVQRKYAREGLVDGATLFVRRDRLVAVKFGRPGVEPLRLGTMRIIEAFAKVGEDEYARLSAHAPSRMSHPVPAGARVLRGTYGFIPEAYERPEQATDGAHFIVNLVGRDGSVTRRLDRWLSPVLVPEEQGEMELSIELAPGEAGTVEFVVEAGGTAAYDWVYWGELRFEGLPTEPDEVSKARR